MISRFTTDLPRCHENLKFVVLSSPLATVDGKLAHFVVDNSSCDVVADFVGKPTSQPHECIGPLRVTDGNAESVVFIREAAIQIEEGTPVAFWPGKVIGQGVVKGIASDGRFWVGRSLGVPPGDERSLTWEFLVSDAPGLKGLSEINDALKG